MRLPIQVQARNARCKARPGSRLGLIPSSCSNDCQTPRSVTTSARRSSRLGWPSRQRFAEARQLRIPAVLAGSVSGRIIDFQNGRAEVKPPPNAVKPILLPGWKRSASSDSATGMLEEDVFPRWRRLFMIRSGVSPRRCAPHREFGRWLDAGRSSPDRQHAVRRRRRHEESSR